MRHSLLHVIGVMVVAACGTDQSTGPTADYMSAAPRRLRDSLEVKPSFRRLFRSAQPLSVRTTSALIAQIPSTRQPTSAR
jgi:hypothetical protein